MNFLAVFLCLGVLFRVLSQMKSHPTGWLFIWHIKERLELIAVVNEAPVALQSRDLSEAAAEWVRVLLPLYLRSDVFPDMII